MAHDKGERGRSRVHDGGSDHHAHGGQVAGRARHEIARAVTLKVREIEPLQVCEEVVPQVVLDATGGADDDPAHQEPERTPDGGECQQGHGIEADRAGVHGHHEIIDGVLQHPRTRESHRSGDDNAHEADEKRAAIPEHVTQQPSARGHSLKV